jgi:mannosyltransferase OCH1-like enzyme
MDTIHYLWGFKPNETGIINHSVIENNLKYVNNYKIWGPEHIYDLLNNDIFPGIAELYNLIPHWVVKTDLVRLLILFFHGGIYSDSDCLIQEYHDIRHYKISLFTEHKCNSLNDLGPRERTNPEHLLRIANYFFRSKSLQHPFLKDVIDECIRRLKHLLYVEKVSNLGNDDILWVCGPDVITTIYHRSKYNYNDIFLYDTGLLQHRCHGSWR